jgi:hypothetical protein
MNRINGTYVGMENMRIELQKLSSSTIGLDGIRQSLAEVTQSAKQDTCDLHYLIQQMVQIFRTAELNNDVVMAESVRGSLMHIGIEITADSWGFIGDSPQVIQLSARMV